MIRRIIHHPAFKTHLRQGIRFVISGLSGAAIELGTTALLVEFAGFPPPLAYFPAGLLSVTFVFFFNRTITFRAGDPRHLKKQTMRFVLVYSLAFAANYLFTVGLYSLGVQYLLAKVIAIGVIAIINYFLSHGFIFKKETVAVV